MTARYSRGFHAVAVLTTVIAGLHAQSPLQIVSDTMAPASLGVPYSQPIVTSGGLCTLNGTASAKIDSGSLPPGLSIISPPDIRQWSLQGTPLAAGAFTFTLHVHFVQYRPTPFYQLCEDDAVKSLTLTVQSGQTIPPIQPPPTQPPATNQVVSADRTSIVTTWHTAQSPPPDTQVRITASSSAALPLSLPFSVQAITDSGFPWLSALPLHATTPATLSIGYLAGSLAPGSYTGRVIVTTDAQAMLTIFVTLQVVTDDITLKVAPASLAFTAILGSPDPPAQSLAVTVAGANAYFQAKVSSAPPNGKWLAVTSAGLTPATLAVAVSAKDLPAGVYQGAIALTPNGSTTGTVTVNVTLTVQAQKPAINPTGIVNAAGLGNAISPGTWVSLFGTSLSATTRAWRDSDFINGNLPTSLDGVTVTINGKFAAVSYISAQQINVLAPDDTSTGLVPVQVRNSLGVSDSVLALQQTLSPALFQQSANSVNYVAGAHLDGSYLVGVELVKAGIPGTPAKAGETIVLFGTGFGATQPASSATAPVSAPLALAHPEDLRIRIGGVDAAIIYAGLISPGVYQFNLVVPLLPPGDKSVVAELRGLLTQAAILPVQ